MHFPVQAESTVLFKSVGDKMQADYLTGAIKEPCELLWLLPGSLVKPLAVEPRLMLSKGFTVKCKYVPEGSSTQPKICPFSTRPTHLRVCWVTFSHNPLVFMSCDILFFYFFIFYWVIDTVWCHHLACWSRYHHLTSSSNRMAAHVVHLFQPDIICLSVLYITVPLPSLLCVWSL